MYENLKIQNNYWYMKLFFPKIMNDYVLKLVVAFYLKINQGFSFSNNNCFMQSFYIIVGILRTRTASKYFKALFEIM